MKIIELEKGKPLSLTNDGELDIFFIGVGSAFAQKHNQTNFLIIKGSNHVMVDFGRTGPEALIATAGISPYDLQVVLPTHSHGDHIGGIEQLAQMNRYVGIPFMKKPKLKMVASREYQRILWENSLRGGLEYNEEFAERKTMDFGDYFDVIRPKWKQDQPREVYEVSIGDIHLELFRTNHIPEQSDSWFGAFISYGLFVDGRILISCDCKFDPELIEMYSGRSEAIFHDVQFFPGAVHAHIKDLETYPADIKSMMYLKHYADNWEEFPADTFAGYTRQGVIYRS